MANSSDPPEDDYGQLLEAALLLLESAASGAEGLRQEIYGEPRSWKPRPRRELLWDLERQLGPGPGGKND